MRESTKQWDVITVGDVFTDLVLSGFSHWPRPGEEAFATRLRREAGGGAAITGCGLARLGCRTALLSSIGSDAEWLLGRLQECGLATELLHRSEEEAAGLTIAVTTAEDRSFFTYVGSNRFLPRLLEEDRTVGTLAAARHVHFALALDPALLKRLAVSLRDAGTSISVDVGWQTEWLRDPGAAPALREVDWFMPNEREAEWMTGQTEPREVLRVFAEIGLRGVALKLGDKGSAALWAMERFEQPPHPVDPVEPTGAGDCFDAGFLYGWLKQQPLAECLRLANLCGALSTRALGGIESFPTKEELEPEL